MAYLPRSLRQLSLARQHCFSRNSEAIQCDLLNNQPQASLPRLGEMSVGGTRSSGFFNAAILSATFVLSTLFSSASFALGLGSLEIKSNLDQPLNGAITLNVSPGDDLDTLTAVIAPRSDFESLGIDYPAYLADIGVVVDQLGPQPLLRVTSNDVIIKEPFIHFLIRVEWSGGSFLREYTALIDPPVYAAEAPQAVSEPKFVGTDERYVSDDQPFEPQSEAQVSDIVDDEQVSETASDDLGESQFSEDLSIDSSAAQQSATDAQYGPVVRGESLSLIAQELQKQFPDLSIYQIMKVLFEENSESFIDNNINGLIAGSVLRVGDLDAIRAVDIVEARGFFRDQLSAWDPSLLNSGSDSAVSVSDDNYNFGSSFDDQDSDSSGSSTTSDSFQVGSSSEQSNLVNADQGGNREGEVLALRSEITQLETSLASSELENQELSERISILEGQLADMNRLLELGVENSGLAQVEATLAQQNTDELAFAEDSALDNIGVDSQEDELDSLLSDVVGDTDQAGEEGDGSIEEFLDDSSESLAEGEALEDDDLLAALDGGSDAGDSVESDLSDTEVAPAAAPSTTASTQSSAPEPTGFFAGLIESVTSSGVGKIIAGVGALLLAFIALFFIRRRRADEEFEISMLSIESNSQTQDTTQHSSDAASLSATQSASVESVAENPDKETSFLTVYSDSDAVVQADEVDPVAEADVYIAYGRDEQAEEVLLDGIASQPDRLDIKQKLLGLYHKNRNVEGFERVAEELYSGGEIGAEPWQEIVQMGQELSPANPLFSTSGVELVNAVDMNSEISVEGDDISEVLTTPEEDSSEAASVEDIADESPEDDAPLELSNSTLEDAVDAINSSESGDEADPIELINFDDGGSEISELDEVEIDALNLGVDDAPKDLTVDVDNVVQLVSEEESSVIEIDLDNEEVLDFSAAPLDEEISFDDDDGERDLREVQEVSDLEIDSGYDEARTQYELAKVFVDLGDEDGARRILNELVANDSNDSDVMDEAKELLKSIS